MRVAIAASAWTLDRIALAYVAVPSAIFVAGWIVWPLGPVAAVALMVGAILATRRDATMATATATATRAMPRAVAWIVAGVAVAWCLAGGQGHVVFANQDWHVRDAVLLDLVRDAWPVRYAVDGVETLLRAPIGYYLPAALVGKAAGVASAEVALAAWTIAGVALTFALMLGDRPTPRAAAVRIGVFILFSGMDIVPSLFRNDPHDVGAHLEWWATIFQYSSQTTQLFWVPNHALPGWIAVAWLLRQDPRRVPVAPAVLFVVLTPLWAPLTALGIAALVGVALVRHAVGAGIVRVVRRLIDWRLVLPVVVCVALVYPFITAGSDKVPMGLTSDFRWIGEDIVQRYVEFVAFEFGAFALLLIARDRRDPLLWTAIAVLLALPIVRFGPYNDLAMRASIPPLTLIAVRMGAWLSSPRARGRDTDLRLVAAIVLVVGAVTPAMEFARSFITARWDMDRTASVIDVTRGTHYLAPADGRWLRTFLRDSDVSQRSGGSLDPRPSNAR